jgi:GNAT superfamily N-acetyltransferase
MQVLSNLLGNAVRFSRERGEICLRATQQGDGVCFSVSDRGCGIPEEAIPHLFDRYWRGKASGRVGAGLGLFIARGIVAAHGGSMWVESTEGVGSTFFFTLPLAPQGEKDAPPRRTVLIVEDDPALLEVTAEKLAAHLFGEKPLVEAIVAERDGRVVAFALFFTNYSTFLAKPGLYLEDLFVEPEQRGSGIGQALLEHLARLAATRGYGRFEWSVLDWNEGAIRFYQRLGATVMPDWRICRIAGPALDAYRTEAA